MKITSKAIYSILWKVTSILRLLFFILALIACALSFYFAYKLYCFWPDSLTPGEKLTMISTCLSVLIAVGGFGITLVVLITDRRKRVIRRLSAQVCAYHVEEDLLIERINLLEDACMKNSISDSSDLPLVEEETLKQQYRALAKHHEKNYLGDYPYMTALDTFKLDCQL